MKAQMLDDIPLDLQQFQDMATLRKGNEYLRDNNFNGAITVYKEVLQKQDLSQKNQLAALYNMAKAYIQQKSYSMAVECYRKILKIDPNYKPGEIYYELGQALQQDKKYEEGIQAYSKYLQRYPNHPECNFNLALAYDDIKRYDEAHRFYEKAYIANPAYSKALHQRASLLIKQYRYKEVLPICDQALNYYPNDPGFHYFRGISYLRLNNLREAESSLSQCLRLDRTHVRAFIALAEAKCRLNDNSGSQLLQACLRENAIKPSERKEIIYWLGIFQMRMGNFRQAILRFQEVLRSSPVMESAKVKLGECLEQEGNNYFNNNSYRDAIRCYEQALRYTSKNKALLNNIGLAHQRISNLSQAERYYKAVLQKYPNDVKALNNLAALSERRGNQEAARNLLDMVIQDRPQNYEAHLHRAKLLMSSHKYQEALKGYKIAEKIKDDDFALHNDIAVALENLGRYKEALQHANRANKLAKNLSPLLLVNRASILMHLRRIPEASKDLNRANRQIRKPDTNNSLWLSTQNRRFIENQLSRYAGLMDPIEEIREEIVKQELKLKINKVTVPKELEDLKEKADNIQTHVMEQLIGLIKKEDTSGVSVRETLQLDVTVKEYIKGLEQKLIQFQEAMEKKVQKLENVAQNAPHKIYLKKLELLRQKDPIIWQYGKQLYWYLYSYLMGYMLANGGVLAKGANIDRSAFNSSLQKISNILEYAQCIPVIGEFSQIVSKMCKVFVGLEDDVIIKKVYQILSHNYDSEEQLRDEICRVVVLFLEDSIKVSKVRYNLIFNPEPQGFFDRFKARLEEVGKWLENKKNEFVMYMRGYKNVEDVKQAELAAVDVGFMISAMLKMEINPSEKQRALGNAAQQVLTAWRLEDMIVEAYSKDKQNSNQSKEQVSSGEKSREVQAEKVQAEKPRDVQAENPGERQNEKPGQEDKNEDSCNLI